MRYLLGGYYGMRNVGDDVLLYVTIAEIAKLDPDAQFTVISDRDEQLPQFAKVKVVAGGRRFETVRRLLRHDVWLFGGGGLLQDPSLRAVRTLRNYQLSAHVAKWFKRKIVAIGIGVGPLETPEGRRAARNLLCLADFVTVRDKLSADLAHELAPECHLSITADLSFLFPKYAPAQQPNPTERKKRTLGVSLLPFSGALGKDTRIDLRMAATFAEALNHLLRERPDWQITLFEFFSGSDSYGDAIVLRALRQQLQLDERVSYRPYSGDFFALYMSLRECSAFLGMRLHSCVLSWLSGVPCLMTDYHMKSSSIAKHMGIRDEAILPVHQLNSSSILTERLAKLMGEPACFLPSVPTGQLANTAAKNFELLRVWLKEQMWNQPARINDVREDGGENPFDPLGEQRGPARL